jgi:two-component system response regulator AtoC
MYDSILIVDDEEDFLQSAKRALMIAGFKRIVMEKDPVKAAALFHRGEGSDVALIDITMPGMSGVQLLELIKNTSPNTECIMITARNEARLAVECMTKGAYDYQVKPISRDELIPAIRRALERKRLLDVLNIEKEKGIIRLNRPEAFKPIVTQSARLLRALKEAELHAGSDVPVLITGESGTGKELLARAIHLASSRAESTFTPVNMASLTGTLFDAEFFGHTRGAFTGADRDRSGYLEHANHGTLFLDEIGTIPIELQGKLLRVLQEGEYIKLGTSQPKKADIRFIAATNEDLDKLMAVDAFRKDLYYRLKGAWIHLMPLRERKEDIPLLTRHFLEQIKKSGRIPPVPQETLSILGDYEFPGNVRELKSIIQSSLNLAQDRPITPEFLPTYLRNIKPQNQTVQETPSGPICPLTTVEKRHILNVYRQLNENKAKTAKCLGIGLNTLRRKLEQYGI